MNLAERVNHREAGLVNQDDRHLMEGPAGNAVRLTKIALLLQAAETELRALPHLYGGNHGNQADTCRVLGDRILDDLNALAQDEPDAFRAGLAI